MNLKQKTKTKKLLNYRLKITTLLSKRNNPNALICIDHWCYAHSSYSRLLIQTNMSCQIDNSPRQHREKSALTHNPLNFTLCLKRPQG